MRLEPVVLVLRVNDMKKWMYYAIQWTWGIVLNIIGGLVFLCTLAADGIYWLFKHKHCCFFYKYRNAICIVVPWNFGGLELGMFFMRGRLNESVCAHEDGHSIQNLWWGPLFIPVIMIPSAVRYWWRIVYRKWFYPKTRKALPPYDAIWFEGQATELGNKAAENYWSWL